MHLWLSKRIYISNGAPKLLRGDERIADANPILPQRLRLLTPYGTYTYLVLRVGPCVSPKRYRFENINHFFLPLH